MAQKVVIQLTCDLCDDDTGAAETIRFGYDDRAYTFELCEAHLEEFHGVMQGYTGAARKAGDGRRPRARRSSATEAAVGVAATNGRGRPTRRDRQHTAAVRQWARDSGYEVSDRGRISAEIAAAYEAANS